MVKVTDIFPNGTSMLIQNGALRMRWRHGPFQQRPDFMIPGKAYRVTIDVGWVAYVLNKGHSLRLTVTSSNWPYYSVNPNTGAPLELPPPKKHTTWPPWAPCEMGACKNLTALNTIHFGEHTSIVLPVKSILPPEKTID
eukprot:COSAG02_NODE_5473_length_4295_cov_17.413966_1_plen_139_part_00